MTADCVTLWVGDRLGLVERACLRSVVRQGHKLLLYCYDEPDGVPPEVELRDASAIVPREEIMQPWCARADLYSDWFRYELLQRGLGTWVDADVYMVAPLDYERPYLFGWEAPDMINNAVLRLPPESALLAALIRPFRERSLPSWIPVNIYLRERARQLLTGRFDLTRIPWGATSPWALTHFARKMRLTDWAQSQDVYYPVHWRDAEWIRDPARRLEDEISPSTVAVHLWNRCIAPFKDQPAAPGSFLDRLQQEGA